MTREEAIRILKTRQDPLGDIEQEHADADTVICELLESLGYEDVVKAYEEVPKWYA